MIKTSIIVPVYNTAAYLRECFNSIFNQTQKEIEVIAINDGSTDESLSILEDIKSKHPEMIIYSQENKGLGASRNKGMELASGEFIYFIDSDDCLVSDAMETCYHYAKLFDVDVVMFDASTFGKSEYEQDAYNRSRIIKEQEVVMSGEEYAQKYWLRAFYPTACLIYTTAYFLKKHHLEFLPRIYYEDNEFHCKMIPLVEKMVYIPEMLYRRRCREGSITESIFTERHAKDYLRMIQLSNCHVHKNNILPIIRKLQSIWLCELFRKCRQNDLLKEQRFVREFYETAQEVFASDIKNLYQFQIINILHWLDNILEDKCLFAEKRLIVENNWKEFWEKCVREIPMQIEDKWIGIYGTGKKAKEFLDAYEQNIGEINANLFFVESFVKSGEKKFWDRDVFNVNDIGNIPIECLVIASSKYEQEMYQTITDQYGDRFRVICLSSDLFF